MQVLTQEMVIREMHIPVRKVGLVIGKGGATIQQLQHDALCYLEVLEDDRRCHDVSPEFLGDHSDRNQHHTYQTLFFAGSVESHQVLSALIRPLVQLD